LGGRRIIALNFRVHKSVNGISGGVCEGIGRRECPSKGNHGRPHAGKLKAAEGNS